MYMMRKINYLNSVRNYQTVVRNLTFSNVDLTEISDGASAERILKDIEEERNIDVDIISGATNSINI